MLGTTAVGRTTVFAGDMNALHRWDPIALALRTTKILRPLSDRLPVGVPGTRQSMIARGNSLYQRLVEMGDGGTLQLMKNAGYRDADDSRLPTKGFVQLDHIMVPKNVSVEDFERLDVYGLSDHLGIRARLYVHPVTDTNS